MSARNESAGMQEDVAGFRLSPQQDRLWRLQQIGDWQNRRSACTVLVDGAFDEAIFADTVRHVVERHEILRTTFRCVSGVTVPVQVPDAGQSPVIRQYDLSDRAASQTHEIEQIVTDQLNRRLDLVHGPLLEIAVIRLAPGRRTLFLTLPGLCADWRGLGNLVRELARHYSARVRQDVLSDEPLQYADLAEWQNQLLETADTEAGRTYWKNHRPRPTGEIALPFPKESIEEGGFHPKVIAVRIDSQLSADIERLSSRLEAPTSALLLAAWRVLLGRLTGQAEIPIGTAFDGRNYEQLEGTIGLFARYLPLSCSVVDDDPFSEVLRRVRHDVEEIAEWQEYFDCRDMLAAADADIEQAHYPLCFDFEEIPPVLSVGDDTTFTIDRLSACTDQFRIKLSSARRQGALSIELHYDHRYFAEGDIERLASQLQTLLTSIAKQPSAPIGDLEIVGESERHRLLLEWNRPPEVAAVVPNGCVQEQFEAQVDRTPDAVAVASSATTLDYRELNARANQLARYLRRAGVGTDTLVGLCVERSPEMVVGILGILKAGGGYVPLDPGYPRQRLMFMIEDAGVSLLVTQQLLRDRFSPPTGSTVCLDADWEAIARESRENLSEPGMPESLAYVIYTSGSTGSPKGVMVSHRALAQYLSWSTREYRVSEGRGAPLHSPLGFDLTITSVFPQLLTGRCVSVLPDDLPVDELGEALSRAGGWSLLKITPSHLALLNQQLSHDRVPGLANVIVIGGEALHGETLRPWRTHAPNTRIVNEYGPTEATVGCCIYEVPGGDGAADGSGAVPIGRPTVGTQIHLLNSRLRLMPTGAAAELYLGGSQLARGYLGRPDSTAAAFVPDAFGDSPGARLYRTADLARYRADGNLEFLGRVDHQVKIRGFRIELGEIEAVLGTYRGVRDVAVLAREDTPGDVRLVAYLGAEADVDVGELRAWLNERLPDYMIPATFLRLESLPLTRNGKVDREALPAPDSLRRSAKTKIAPRTPREEILATIWSQVLRLDEVGVEDDFFDLGGHSLLALQILTRLNAAFQVNLSYRDLFESPTVASLAARLETAASTGLGAETRAIERTSRQGVLPLSFAQERLWFMHQVEPDNPFYSMVRIVRFNGALDLAAFEQTIAEIVRRHETLRTAFLAEGGQPRQCILEPGRFPAPIADLSSLTLAEREPEARRVLSDEMGRPFDLARAPLLRVKVLRLTPREHIVVFTMHHIVSDGWSIERMIAEFTHLYAAFSQGGLSPLRELGIQYADFASWQRHWLQGEVLEAHLSYWTKQLQGEPAPLLLPTRHPRPAAPTRRGATQSIRVSGDLYRDLAELGRSEGVTSFMLLLAAFQTLLYRYSGQDDIVVGTPVSGRTRSETDPLIGFFVNTLVLRTDFSGPPSFREVLARVRRVCLDAYSHESLPYQKLVEQLRPLRTSNRALFQVWFQLDEPAPERASLHGLEVSSFKIDNVATEFDLWMSISHRDGGLDVTVHYGVDLFDADTVDQMLRRFERILADVAARPDLSVSALSMAAESETQQLLNDFNAPVQG
ncbi:MAG TPA: amino acid adenylation domain-containing protein [Vicinamibacterales bacterium]|nr:amino acid adenylation domain-containing protein [Vicinamibacterales bacterium]